MEKFNVSVILPIKSALAFDFDEYFPKAISSLKEQKIQIGELIIVHTDETKLLEVLEFVFWIEFFNLCLKFLAEDVVLSNKIWV